MRLHFQIGKTTLTFLIASGFVCLLLLGFHSTAQAQSRAQDEPQSQPAENDACLSCHDHENMVMSFPNGEKLSVTVEETAYQQSVHGQIACTDCHNGYEGFPHPDNHIMNAQDYSLSFHDSCQRCHPNQFEMVEGSVHEELLRAGLEGTPGCTDCHNPHAQVRISQLGDNPEAHYSGSPEICASCHAAEYDTYAVSIHGEQLLAGNPDMPTCIDCHSVHEIYNPREGQFRKDSIDMCAKCHTDTDLMEKYDLESNVLDTYLVFHDTTVTLLEEYDPDSMTNKPTCYDCHGIHNVGEFTPPALDFSMPGADQYAPIAAKASALPVEDVGFTGTIVGLVLGCLGTLTISQLLKERKQNGSGKKSEQKEDQK